MAIVRHIGSGALYRYLGENIFINCITGAKGHVDDELARKIFKINLEATVLFDQYPNVEDLVRRLKLKMEKHTDNVSGSQGQENGQT